MRSSRAQCWITLKKEHSLPFTHIPMLILLIFYMCKALRKSATVLSDVQMLRAPNSKMRKLPRNLENYLLSDII